MHGSSSRKPTRHWHRERRHAAFAIGGGGQILIGIAALVLGILALIPIHAAVLTLVGLLAVGASLLMSGAASSGVMASAKTV